MGILAKNRIGQFGRSLDLQILNELKQSFGLEGLEEIRLIKDKRTGEGNPLPTLLLMPLTTIRIVSSICICAIRRNSRSKTVPGTLLPNSSSLWRL